MEPDPFLQALPAGADVPSALYLLHTNPGQYEGRCSIIRGSGWIIRLALQLGRFPPDADDIPVKVKIDCAGDTWPWARDFDGHTTRSLLTFDHGTDCVREQLGWLTLWLMPEIDSGRMIIHIRGLSIFGVSCPTFFLPRLSTVEWQDETGQFRFDVSAAMPGLGQLICYRGWLKPVHGQACTG
ncbi:hypothetical protein RUE5091_01083 [Ruegeria denitrificans]|uniref:DUF4166 domain-containing protein n=1 Tax=Ruegeria denitrificans TaxID=1715692 RepID=A0A0P1IDB8_9RHOB|nr:DUF4166 domain-containing protein [Ruegeria denitrificans]CUJ91318.1 hypothetical protein RUE5091_01083 [Ruegeria denitrificans]